MNFYSLFSDFRLQLKKKFEIYKKKNYSRMVFLYKYPCTI